MREWVGRERGVEHQGVGLAEADPYAQGGRDRCLSYPDVCTYSAFSLSTTLPRVGDSIGVGRPWHHFLTPPYLPDHRLLSWLE